MPDTCSGGEARGCPSHEFRKTPDRNRASLGTKKIWLLSGRCDPSFSTEDRPIQCDAVVTSVTKARWKLALPHGGWPNDTKSSISLYDRARFSAGPFTLERMAAGTILPRFSENEAARRGPRSCPRTRGTNKLSGGRRARSSQKKRSPPISAGGIPVSVSGARVSHTASLIVLATGGHVSGGESPLLGEARWLSGPIIVEPGHRTGGSSLLGRW